MFSKEPSVNDAEPGQANKGQIANPAILGILLPCAHHVGQTGGESRTLNLTPSEQAEMLVTFKVVTSERGTVSAWRLYCEGRVDDIRLTWMVISKTPPRHSLAPRVSLAQYPAFL